MVWAFWDIRHYHSEYLSNEHQADHIGLSDDLCRIVGQRPDSFGRHQRQRSHRTAAVYPGALAARGYLPGDVGLAGTV